MADHVRSQIREAVRVRMEAIGLGATVHKGRRHSLPASQLPAIVIYSQTPTTEASEIAGMRGPTNRRLSRLMNLVIDIIDADNDQVDERLDEIAADVEAAIDTDIYLTTDDVQLTKGMSLARTDIMFAEMGAQTTALAVGILRMTYAVRYDTLTGTPRAPA